jgi:hypothetical protein
MGGDDVFVFLSCGMMVIFWAALARFESVGSLVRLAMLPERNLSFLFFFHDTGIPGSLEFFTRRNCIILEERLRSYMHEML